jgi:hypothetical protein
MSLTIMAMDISTENPAAHRAAQVHADHIGNMGTYIYHIRNILGWMLAIWLISIAAAVGVGIYLGAHSGQVASSNCLSQGGTNTSC